MGGGGMGVLSFFSSEGKGGSMSIVGGEVDGGRGGTLTRRREKAGGVFWGKGSAATVLQVEKEKGRRLTWFCFDCIKGGGGVF